jgi:hypothetical protein
MRTTLTIDPDVAERLRHEVHRSGKSMKALVNEALRLSLGMAGKPAARPRFKVEPHALGFKAGIDLDRINQLVDELEAEETARTVRK